MKTVSQGIHAKLGTFLSDDDTARAPRPRATGNSLLRAGQWLATDNGYVFESHDGLLTALCGNFGWRDKELSDRAVRLDPQGVVALAYRRYGEQFLEQLTGRFSVAVWDPARKTGLVATDRFARLPVYWAHRDGTTWIAPTADQVMQDAGLSPEVSHQALYHYLFFHMVPSPGTIYPQVNKLPAAHALRIDRHGATPFCYWMPSFNEQASALGKKADENMLQLLRTAVAQLDGGATTGAFLSGGLDSSSVSGMLAQNREGTPAATFSIGFDAPGYDEIAYARIASEHFHTQAFEYYVTPEDVLDALPRVAAAYDEPFGNSSAIPAYFCARLAREQGMQRLLAGDGGDELFAGNARYAKQTVFEVYQRLPPALRDRLLEPLAARLPRNGALGKLNSYINQARVPLPARLHTYNFLTRFALDSVFSGDFIEQVDTQLPFRLEEEIYQRPESASRLNRMLYLDWQHTLADNDLRKVNRMCELAGIEVEYPMLDDHLVEFSALVPSARKMRFNRLRHFYKDAVSGFLPEQIIHKKKHGFGLPFGVWMSSHKGLQELAHDNLSSFRQRGIMNGDFLDELLTLHDSSHAGYYGEMVWLLVMLELWLNERGL
jgi:asparagine synthase (glutamine-hydrolysing)